MVRRICDFVRQTSGAAAAEFAMFVLILAPLLLNLGDIGYYAYVRMQVENAAQAGAQAAWANCSTKPASSANCPNLSNAVTSAVTSTSLGNLVSWTNSSSMFTGTAPRGVDTYCPTATNSTNALVYSSSNCSNTSSTGSTPGTYARIDVSYTFRPLFRGATIASLFPATITATTYQRLY
jgi:Flp pilus assembly protein TadG